MGEHQNLGRQAASDAVAGAGWHFILGGFEATIPVRGVSEGVGLLSVVAPAAPEGVGFRASISDDAAHLRLQDPLTGWVGASQVQAALAITERLIAHGWAPDSHGGRSVQRLELAIDTRDATAIRPFWEAVLDYTEQGEHGELFDPRGEGPTVWFQEMESERPQRNRIHLDITVPHLQASDRINAALQAGGHLVSDEFAPSWWVLGDADGNEVCVCTWLDRDERRDAERRDAEG